MESSSRITIGIFATILVLGAAEWAREGYVRTRLLHADDAFRTRVQRERQRLAATARRLPDALDSADARQCPQTRGPIYLADLQSLRDTGASESPSWLQSTSMRYVLGSVSPSLSDRSIRDANTAVGRLETARYLAVLYPERTEQASPDGEHSFRGGEVMGTIAVVDRSDASIVCQFHVASAPLVAVAVRQSNEEANDWAVRRGVEQAAEGAFWREVERASSQLPNAPSITRE